mmetsp:Transcript_4619/g.10895  ORF Transcript_4619/g.10895 Transcript_4619/m.10895 type:complete len:209 (-) Transcript_4619:69-695(-)
MQLHGHVPVRLNPVLVIVLLPPQRGLHRIQLLLGCPNIPRGRLAASSSHGSDAGILLLLVPCRLSGLLLRLSHRVHSVEDVFVLSLGNALEQTLFHVVQRHGHIPVRLNLCVHRSSLRLQIIPRSHQRLDSLISGDRPCLAGCPHRGDASVRGLLRAGGRHHLSVALLRDHVEDILVLRSGSVHEHSLGKGEGDHGNTHDKFEGNWAM